MDSLYVRSYAIKLLLFTLLLINNQFLSAQVGISTDGSLPEPTSMLDVQSTSKGVLFPRMTTQQIAAIQNPANGLMVFNLDNSRLYVYLAIEGKWKELNFGEGTISPAGNTGPCVTFTDVRDGKTYNTVLIGLQCWMAQNLNIGTRISGMLDQSDNGITEKYCYNDLDSNCAVYGGLYQWNEMMNYVPQSSSNPSGVTGICPAGWHIPSDAEWTQLSDFLGGLNPAGCALKEAGYAHWQAPNYCATNSSGFTALGAGFMGTGGPVYAYYSLQAQVNFYSASEYAPDGVIGRSLESASAGFYQTYGPKINGFSVRCLRN